MLPWDPRQCLSQAVDGVGCRPRRTMWQLLMPLRGLVGGVHKCRGRHEVCQQLPEEPRFPLNRTPSDPTAGAHSHPVTASALRT